MTQAKIQPCCNALNFKIGYFKVKEIYTWSVTERNKVLYLYNDHFCLLWKSEGVSFSKTNVELKSKWETVNNYIIDENVDSYFKNENKPQKHKLNRLILLYMT